MGIRPATIRDLDSVRKCATEAYSIYVERMGKKPAPMAADFESKQIDGNLHVMEEETQVMGFIIFYPKDRVMHLENVAVSPAAQGKGYGSQLIDFAERTARNQGFEMTELYTNEKMTENFNYYKSKGYVEIGRWEENGFKRVFYRKNL